MRSPVSWALLGLVIQRPSYGYELVQRFERTYGDALELSSPSQVYTALDTLARKALIEEIPAGAGDGVVRQPKPHYRATAAGEHDFQDWLVAQLHDERRRSRLFAHQLAVLPVREALAVVGRYEQECLKQASRAPMAATGEHSSEGSSPLASRLVDEEERLALDARLSWIEYARRELTALAAAPARIVKS
jgi:DNA-binding PadR family transcriptional regulator